MALVGTAEQHSRHDAAKCAGSRPDAGLVEHGDGQRVSRKGPHAELALGPQMSPLGHTQQWGTVRDRSAVPPDSGR